MADLADPATKTVLIVDDDASMCDMLELWVKSEGFKTLKSGSGPDAVQKADLNAPDLIILDFMLPGAGGYEVAKELQMGDARGVPIIIITGRRLDRQTADMLRHEPNVKEYIEKPVKPAVLASHMHRLLGTQPPAISRKQDRGPLSSGW